MQGVPDSLGHTMKEGIRKASCNFWKRVALGQYPGIPI